MSKEKIYYTLTDEAPALATYSFLNTIQSFTAQANIEVEAKNISLARRVLVLFPELLTKDQQISDDLTELGKIIKTAEANIIKLPNISASIPQLKACITELQQKGYNLPNYPEKPQNNNEEDIKSRYDSVKGSAVNPILREGNSDRRAPKAVKNFAKKNPHSMGKWTKSSKSHVASMVNNDFYSSEKSTIINKDSQASIIFESTTGVQQVLKEKIALLAEEIIDCSVMNVKALADFFTEEINNAKQQEILFSLHMKATMMKVSDPIIFGVAIRIFYKEVFVQFADLFAQLDINANNGIGDVYTKISGHPQEEAVKKAIEKVYENRPAVAMVNSEKGITNLHVPSDIIIDASMPTMIRNSGQMWNNQGNGQDTKAVIPDHTYAGIYQASIDFCKNNGAFDPTTMGSVSNVGLMAQKAEEYGSHDKTFQLQETGFVKIVDNNGDVLLSQKIAEGDIFRMCQVKDIPIRNWVKLAIERATDTKDPAVFWLDEERAHDRNVIYKVQKYLSEYDIDDLDILILSPIKATTYSMQRMKKGLDTISVTGNILRDYLTDLFPILEVGTSAKMLSIVPLLNGGGLFETGAGGSAPKHVEQFINENYLRWDSLGEFLALTVSLEHLAKFHTNSKAKVLANTLDIATSEFLEKNKSPTRKIGGIDTRGSHFYLTMYWAKALAKQTDDKELQNKFTEIANKFKDNHQKIIEELIAVQNQEVDIQGYYKPVEELVQKVMNPSQTFKNILSLI